MAVSKREIYSIIYNNVRNKYKSWTEEQVRSRTNTLMHKRNLSKLPKEKYLYNGQENVLMRSTELPSMVGTFLVWIDAEFMLLEVAGKRIACSKFFWEVVQ